jgi:hypothetical protein
MLIQLLCFWTLSIALFLFKTQRFGVWILSTFSGEPTQLGPIDRASIHLRAPAPTRDRVYKSSTA